MRKITHATVFILVVFFCWLSSFWITRSRAVSRWQEGNPAWMQNVSDEVITTEQQFCAWIEKHTQALKHERMTLVQLLESSESDDQAILAQAELVASNHAELLRGVGKHLKTMRLKLPDCQKKLLAGFCHQTLGGTLRRGGHGHQGGGCAQTGQSGHSGMGNGRRHGCRQRHCGLIRKLQMTDEQLVIAEQKDPDFEEDIRQLQGAVLSERRQLYSLLEDQQNLNGQITQQIENLIATHNVLEKRLIGYVLTMRPHFSAQQQKRLIGLCGKNCSGS